MHSASVAFSRQEDKNEEINVSRKVGQPVYTTSFGREPGSARSHAENVTPVKSFKCCVVGCSQDKPHALWACIK